MFLTSIFIIIIIIIISCSSSCSIVFVADEVVSFIWLRWFLVSPK